jgi:hypothetical protein
MINALNQMENVSLYVATASPIFDATSFVKGNGYRSLLALVAMCAEIVVRISSIPFL